MGNWQQNATKNFIFINSYKSKINYDRATLSKSHISIQIIVE